MIPIEPIPDECRLFQRVHKNNIKNGKPIPGAFKERGEGDAKGMSMDWGKYSSAIKTQSRKGNPQVYGVIKLIVGRLREIDLKVLHYPLPDNLAHTNVKGIPENNPRKNKIRLQLRALSKWELFPE